MTLATGLSLSTKALQPRKPFWRGLGFQIIIAMALGIAVGILFPPVAVKLKILGDIFLRRADRIILLKLNISRYISSVSGRSWRNSLPDLR